MRKSDRHIGKCEECFWRGGDRTGERDGASDAGRGTIGDSRPSKGGVSEHDIAFPIRLDIARDFFLVQVSLNTTTRDES